MAESQEIHPRPAQKVYGFYLEETNTFFYCSTEEEYTHMKVLIRLTQILIEESTCVADYGPSLENCWEPLMEIFEDVRFTGPAPNPVL